MNPDLKQILIATIPSILPVHPSRLHGWFGILINKNDTNRLSGEIGSLRGEMGVLRTRMESRFDVLTKELHDNVVTWVNVGNDLGKRISRLEDKG